MSKRIIFSFDVRRFVNSAAYLVEKCPEVTKMKLSKLLYFADKIHLLTYGKPILGDRYIKMEYGPVPSCGYNLMKNDDRSPVEDQALFDHHLRVDGNDIILKAPANLRALSETNKEVLDEVARKFGHLTPAQLSRLSHHDPAWANADMNAEMDYRLFFASCEGTDAVQRLVEDDQELRDALESVELEEFLGTLRS